MCAGDFRLVCGISFGGGGGGSVGVDGCGCEVGSVSLSTYGYSITRALCLSLSVTLSLAPLGAAWPCVEERRDHEAAAAETAAGGSGRRTVDGRRNYELSYAHTLTYIQREFHRSYRGAL